MSLLDITHVCGPNAGGLKKFYTCLKEDVESIPDPTASTLNVATDIVCKTGKKFAEWYFSPDSGKLTITAPGEVDGKSRESMAEIFIPGLSAAKELELDKVLNCQSIIIVPDNNGNMRIIGDLDRGAILESIDATTGGPMTERNGSLVKFKYNSKQAPYYYTGAVPLTPAS